MIQIYYQKIGVDGEVESFSGYKNSISLSRAWYGTTENRQYGFIAVSLAENSDISVSLISPSGSTVTAGNMGTAANIDISTVKVKINGYNGPIKYVGGPISVSGSSPSSNPFNYVSGQEIELTTRYTVAMLVF